MSIVKIMNLSSGGILFFGDASIPEQVLKYDLKWDSTDVIGRMSGIKNYSNTTKTRAVKITGETGKSKFIAPTDQYSVPNDISKMKTVFDKTTQDINPTNYTGKDLQHLINSGPGSIDRFFYPSYQEEAVFLPIPLSRDQATHFMQSAPLFFLEFLNGEMKFRTYCIIKNFNFSVRNQIVEKKIIEKFDLSFELEEIPSHITQVSSMVYTKLTS